MTIRAFALPLLLVASSVCLLHSQEEDGRPAGEVTRDMLDRGQTTRISPVIPTPQESYWGKGSFALGGKGGDSFSIELKGRAKSLPLVAEEFSKRTQQRFGAAPSAQGSGVHFVFALDAQDAPADAAWFAEKLQHLASDEGYVLHTAVVKGERFVIIVGKSEQGLWHGMATAAALIERRQEALQFPEIDVVDYPVMSPRALLVDLGGQGFMVGPSRWEYTEWKDFVDWMVDHKLNNLWLEIIGSGRLMGNLDPDRGEWIGYPLDLKSYPQLVAKDRPIPRWDAATSKVVQDRYTAPNVRHDFVRELIDYAQARGVKCTLLVGYDYFSSQFQVVLGVPGNDPKNREANKVYDTILKEVVQRYSNASGVYLITIENKNVGPDMVDDIIRRTHDGYNIIRAINPKMDVALLCDYLEWRPLVELERLRQGLPADVGMVYSPHRQPQQKAWKRTYDNLWRYELYSQYAWDHIAYIFPERIRRDLLESYADGYRRTVSQAWYGDVFTMNYLALAEYSWNLTPGPGDGFWDKALTQTFGAKARDFMRTALAHTRFDIRFDIVSRMITRERINAPFSFWDMYTMTKIDRLTDQMLADLEDDATQSAGAATSALPLVTDPRAREMVQVVISSGERRLQLAKSGRHLLKALQLQKDGDLSGARGEIERCLADGEKMLQAAQTLGIEYPIAVHDLKVVERYRQLRDELAKPTETRK